MMPAPASPFLPVATGTSVVEQSPAVRGVRVLIWLYLILLLIEGALRKWAVPTLSDPLLIIRDPVVLAIYLLAWRANLFPRNGFVILLAIIGGLSLAISILYLYSYIPIKVILLFTLY